MCTSSKCRRPKYLRHFKVTSCSISWRHILLRLRTAEIDVFPWQSVAVLTLRTQAVHHVFPESDPAVALCLLHPTKPGVTLQGVESNTHGNPLRAAWNHRNINIKIFSATPAALSTVYYSTWHFRSGFSINDLINEDIYSNGTSTLYSSGRLRIAQGGERQSPGAGGQ